MYYYAPFMVFTMCSQNRALPHQRVEHAVKHPDANCMVVEEVI